MRPLASPTAHRGRLRAAGSRRAVRAQAAWVLGIAGLLAYNWWVLVLLSPGLMRSPSELFSNLEVTGQPYATAMQHADLLAGLLLCSAFLAAGSKSLHGARGEWLAMVAAAIAGGVGGLFPQVCDDGLSRACMSMEWQFRLAASQYVHDGSGIAEFFAVTTAFLLAFRRTRGGNPQAAAVYRHLVTAAFFAYPLAGLAYLTGQLGAVVEAAFFLGFTAVVVMQLAERTQGRRAGADRRCGTLAPGQAPAWGETFDL